MNAKQLPRELYLFFGSKEVAEKIYKMIHGEQVKNTEELANLEQIQVREREENLQDAGLPRRVVAFSGRTQGDAAAKLDDDDESCGGGGARAATEVARGRR